MSNRIIGIDLGSTFSAMAVVAENGVPVILPNREGERITPSVVWFDGDTPLVGTLAKGMAASAPLNVVEYIKRQMGNRDWKFRTDSGTAYTPEEISACILKRLKEDAEAALGGPIQDAVITVPAYFNDAQRQATKDAGRIAGLNVVRMINEPTAAALAYGLKQGAATQTVLVYDLGGGTFDVTLLRIADGEIVVVATGGDKNLGGFDWDNCLMNHLNERCRRDGGMDLLDNPTHAAELRVKCELAKKVLSGRDKANVGLMIGGKTVTVAVTLDEFETLTQALLKRTVSMAEFVLEDARLKWSDLDKILLVGGSTRMKGVSRWLREASNLTPSQELHPDEVVALGAAVQAAMLERDAGALVLAPGASLPLLEECRQQHPKNGYIQWELAIAYVTASQDSWTQVGEGQGVPAGPYATTKAQVINALELIGKAEKLEFDDDQLRAEIRQAKESTNSSPAKGSSAKCVGSQPSPGG